MKYKKKPVTIEAVQYDETNIEETLNFAEGNACYSRSEGLLITTLEGTMHASDGDYIIKGVNGEFYPCKPDIFAKTYEPENRSTVGMTFGEALDALKHDLAVRRKGWNGKGIFIALKRPTNTSDMTHAYIYIDTTGLLTDNPYAPKDVVPWLASQTDMLADDWEIVLSESRGLANDT